jgi:uncharacterized protein (TIGR02118 family)
VFPVTVRDDHPEDPARFDEHDDGVHAPLTATIPGLRRCPVTRPGPGPDGTPPPYHLVAVTEYESEGSEAVYGAATATPEGCATRADLDGFATAGVTVPAGPAGSVG